MPEAVCALPFKTSGSASTPATLPSVNHKVQPTVAPAGGVRANSTPWSSAPWATGEPRSGAVTAMRSVPTAVPSVTNRPMAFEPTADWVASK